VENKERLKIYYLKGEKFSPHPVGLGFFFEK
jgi:hypothetical protein